MPTAASRASVWEQVPFRDVAYAEDHLLAQDMLRAGFAKVYMPDAAVVHSHEYSAWQWLRRSFDESRAIAECLRRGHRWTRRGRGAQPARQRDGRLALGAAQTVVRPASDSRCWRRRSSTTVLAAGRCLGAHAGPAPWCPAPDLSLEGRR